jgi:hypothetical protein
MRTLWISILLETPALAQAPRTVDAVRIISGAILADGFDEPDLDSRIWHRPDCLVRHNRILAWRPSTGNCILAEFRDQPAEFTNMWHHLRILPQDRRGAGSELARPLGVRSRGPYSTFHPPPRRRLAGFLFRGGLRENRERPASLGGCQRPLDGGSTAKACCRSRPHLAWESR